MVINQWIWSYHRLYSLGQSVKVCGPVAKGLFVFMMRQEDGKVI